MTSVVVRMTTVLEAQCAKHSDNTLKLVFRLATLTMTACLDVATIISAHCLTLVTLATLLYPWQYSWSLLDLF